MGDAKAHGWEVLDEGARVLVLQYRFAHGKATALAAGLGEGELVLISPPSQVTDAVYDDLERYGKVTAIVAPNGYHHLGVPHARARYPEAVFYAPEGAIPRLRKKAKDTGDIAPLSALTPRLPEGVMVAVPPGMRVPDLVARVRTDEGWIWYANDVIGNLSKPFKNPIMRFLMKVTRSGPGFAVNRLFCKYFVKNKAVFGRWLVDERFLAHPARIFVVGHGRPYAEPGVADRSVHIVRDAFGIT